MSDSAMPSPLASAFPANLPHEIRTPVNILLGMLELLDETELSAEQDSYVSYMRRAGNELLAVMHNLIDLSRLEQAHGWALEFVQFELLSLLKKVIDMLAYQAKRKQLEVLLLVEPDVPLQLIGPTDYLFNILFNLVHNALKFTDQGQVSIHVKLASSEPELSLRFEVKDTGSGIPDAHKQLIFDRFRQGDTSTTRQYGGLGVGLSLAQAWVARLGGQISLESVLGQGSCFYFTAYFQSAQSLPVNRPSPPPLAPSPPLPAQAARILLIEDDLDNQSLFKAYLKSTPYTLYIANHGQQALDLLANQTIDLILMDIQMPVMDGYTFIRRLREMEKSNGQHLPVIALTAHSLSEYLDSVLQAGCDSYLTKPLRKQQLLDAIQRHLPNQQTDPIFAYVDPDLLELIPRFLENRQTDLKKLQAALVQQDYKLIYTLGHNMKGYGRSYGFTELSDYGAALEQAGKAEEPKTIEKILSDLKHYLTVVEVVPEGQ